MSRRLIMATAMDDQVVPSHSAIDDLESFVWVLFSTILHAMKFHEATFSRFELYYWSCFQLRDPVQLGQRTGFYQTLKLQNNASKAKPPEITSGALKGIQPEVTPIALKDKQPEVNPGALKANPTRSKISGYIPSRAFKPFIGLLLDWLGYARDLDGLNLNKISADYPESVRPHLERYLEIAVTHLEGLPDTWEYAKEPSDETLPVPSSSGMS